jgi:hypothetical protein
MNDGQWLFWATAGPFCALGLLIWLAYLGTLQTWMKRLRALKPKKSTQ